MSGVSKRSWTHDLLSLRPHAGAHRVALRAAVSVAIPLLVLWATGHIDWSMYAAFGAFTSLYGRGHRHRTRLKMQSTVALVQVTAVTLGVLVGVLDQRSWWSIPIAAVLAGLVAVLSDVQGWHPPGPLFALFGFAACASIPSTLGQVPIALAVSAGSAGLAVAIGAVGRLGRVESRKRRNPTGQVTHRLSDRWRDGIIRLHLVRYVAAVAVSGVIATGVGIGHPYWAMVSAVVPMAGPDLAAQLNRGVHRLVGTVLGLGMSAVLLALGLRGLALIVLIVALQSLAELLVGRNYGLALVFITPLALLMGQLVAPRPNGILLFDRGVETLIGVLIGIGMTVLTRDRGSRTTDPSL